MKNILSKIIKTELHYEFLFDETRQGVLYKILNVKVLTKVLGKTISSVSFITDNQMSFVVNNVSVISDLSSNTGLQHHFISKSTRNA